MRYDLYYIKHMSALLDLRILALTVQAVLSGRESPDDDAATPAGAADPYALSGRLMTSPALARSVTTSPPQ